MIPFFVDTVFFWFPVENREEPIKSVLSVCMCITGVTVLDFAGSSRFGSGFRVGFSGSKPGSKPGSDRVANRVDTG